MDRKSRGGRVEKRNFAKFETDRHLLYVHTATTTGIPEDGL